MPYFSWRAIDFMGKVHKGVSFARTVSDLEKSLLKDERGLMRAIPRKHMSLSSQERSDFCYHMHLLLAAGVRLADALETVTAIGTTKTLQPIIADCARAIREGTMLSVALSWHDPLFDEIMIQLIRAGEETGALTTVFEILYTHFIMQHELVKKLRFALILPLITSIVFVLILVSTFVFVIPRFEQFFMVLNKTAPPLTQVLFSISAYVRSITGIGIIAGLCLGILLTIKLFSRSHYKIFRDRVVFKIPLVGRLIYYYSFSLFLRTLAILLVGGMRLTQALFISATDTENSMMKKIFLTFYHDVERGISLSASIAEQNLGHVSELVALCILGEASGNLAVMIKRAAQLYQEKTYRILSIIMTLIPSVLLVLIGLFVGLLIIALYVPLLNLGEMMS